MISRDSYNFRVANDGSGLRLVQNHACFWCIDPRAHRGRTGLSALEHPHAFRSACLQASPYIAITSQPSPAPSTLPRKNNLTSCLTTDQFKYFEFCHGTCYKILKINILQATSAKQTMVGRALQTSSSQGIGAAGSEEQ